MPKISDDRKEATRRRLVDAAVQVILTKGPAAATTRQILEAAGLSAGAMYHYFPSKDDLYEAIAQGFADRDGLPELPADATVEQAMDHHCAALRALFAAGNHSILGQLRVAARSSDAIGDALARFDQAMVDRAVANNRVTQRLGLFRNDIDLPATVETIAVFHEGFALRRATAFATDDTSVLAVFIGALADHLIDPEHPAATEFTRRLLEAVR